MSIRFFSVLYVFFIFSLANAQDDETYFGGTLINSKTQQPIYGANIINLTSLKGSSSNEQGMFSIIAKPKDSIMISFMGLKTVNVKVTENNIHKHQTIYMVEKPFVLDEVIVTSDRLTGSLPVDVNLIPIRKPIDISPKLVAMFGNPKPNALSRLNDILGNIMNPVDLIYNIFSTKGKDIRRLRRLKEEDKVREILANRFDREILSRLLKIDKKDVYLTLELCDYPEKFIKNANDLQILEAILNCYNKYNYYFDEKDKRRR